jgi:hypothetical protein
MKKLLLALTGLLFIACSAGGGKSMSAASGGAESTAAPLTEEAAATCDTAGLAAKIAEAPSITSQSLFVLVSYLQSQASDCSQADVITALATYLTEGTPAIVKICPAASNCSPTAADAEKVVQTGITAAVAVDNNPQTVLQIAGVVTESAVCVIPIACVHINPINPINPVLPSSGALSF